MSSSRNSLISGSLSFLYLCLIFTTVFGQNQLISDQALEEFELTTDRDLYISGEAIWFSVQSRAKSDPKLPAISKIMYVELFNWDKNVIARGKFPLVDGLASGMLVVPDEQPSGVYQIRAYTQYLKNFDPRILPMKIVQVVNPRLPLDKESEIDLNEVILQPQGGKLVAGMNSQVFFRTPKSLASSVSTVDLRCGDSLVHNQVVLYENGLGKFQIKPVDSLKYQLHFLLANGDSLIVPLPQPEISGSLVDIKDQKNEVIYSLLNPTKNPFAGVERYHLTVSSGQFATVFQDSVSGASPVIEFIINRDQIPAGNNYFILKNRQGKILDISLFYQAKIDILPVEIRLSKNEYNSNEQVRLHLESNDLKDEEIARLSVSVIKKGTRLFHSKNLPDYLVDRPDLINPTMLMRFDNKESILDQVRIALGLFSPKIQKSPDWIEELTQHQRILKYIPESRNLTISGYVKNTTSQSGVGGTNVLLSYIGDNAQVHLNETQEDGYFIFAIDRYNTYQDLLLCTFDENPDQEIFVNNDYLNNFPDLERIPIEIDTGDRKLLEEMFINFQLEQLQKEVDISTSTDEESYRLGFGIPDISIRLEDYIDLPSMEVVLNEIVPYVKIRKRKGKYHMSILDSETGLTYENHLILVDNIPLDDVDELMSIHPAKVEKVEVINRTYVIGDHTFRGVLMVTTFTENFGGITLPGDAVFIKYPMSSVSPGYTNVTQLSDKSLREFRNVLFWEPEIKIANETELTFYTSSHLSTYQVFIQGVTSEGRIIYEIDEFSVIE